MAYIGRSLQAGSFRQLDDISSSFNGSTTAFTMQVNSTNVSMGDVNQIQLSLGGVIQKPGTDFTISGSTLTFTTAPAANTSFFAVLLGSDNGGTVTPTDGSVTKAKLADEVDIFAGTSLSAADLGAGIHIKIADSGASVNANRDELILENSGHCGMTILSGTSSVGGIGFGDSDGNLQGLIQYSHANEQFEFNVNSSANPVNINSSGLAIGGTGAANTLDDYEEGTWTPAIASGFYAENGYYTQTGRYVKIGRQVICQFAIRTQTSGWTSNGNPITISGVPFTMLNDEARAWGCTNYHSMSPASVGQFYGNNNSTVLQIYYDGDSAFAHGSNHTDGSGKYIIGGFNFEIA